MREAKGPNPLDSTSLAQGRGSVDSDSILLLPASVLTKVNRWVKKRVLVENQFEVLQDTPCHNISKPCMRQMDG